MQQLSQSLKLSIAENRHLNFLQIYCLRAMGGILVSLKATVSGNNCFLSTNTRNVQEEERISYTQFTLNRGKCKCIEDHLSFVWNVWIGKKKIEKIHAGLYGIRTHDLCDTNAEF